MKVVPEKANNALRLSPAHAGPVGDGLNRQIAIVEVLQNVGLHEVQSRCRESALPIEILLLRARFDEVTDKIGQVLRRRSLTNHVELSGDIVAERDVAFDHGAQNAIMSERLCQPRLRRRRDL